jgi:hypothetical protein
VDDTFRAGDLTDEHLGWYVRTREYEGYLRALHRPAAFPEEVQLLLVDGDGPFLPVLPPGEPVEVSPDPP